MVSSICRRRTGSSGSTLAASAFTSLRKPPTDPSAGQGAMPATLSRVGKPRTKPLPWNRNPLRTGAIEVCRLATASLAARPLSLSPPSRKTPKPEKRRRVFGASSENQGGEEVGSIPPGRRDQSSHKAPGGLPRDRREAQRSESPVVGPESQKNISSSELWAVTGRWFVTPDSRYTPDSLPWRLRKSQQDAPVVAAAATVAACTGHFRWGPLGYRSLCGCTRPRRALEGG
jgi:hypothetical protein